MLVTQPDTVQIGDTFYAVTPLPDNADSDGEFCAKNSVIRLRGGVSRAYSKYLLAHEIVHGMLEHAGALAGEGEERFTEEQVACLIGRALPDLLKKNPDLVRYLTHD